MKRFSIPILFLICLGISIKNLEAQTFVRLDDATGIPLTSEKLDSIQKACDSLIASLPNSIKSNFKVFDCGFYLQQTSYQGSYPDVFLNMIAKAQQQSDYYLLIGKGLNEKGNLDFIIDVNFPNWPCINEDIVNGLKEEIKTFSKSIEPSQQNNSEVNTILHVKEFINNLKECCYLGNKLSNNSLNPLQLKVFMNLGNGPMKELTDNSGCAIINSEALMPDLGFKLQYAWNINEEKFCPNLYAKFMVYYSRDCSTGNNYKDRRDTVKYLINNLNLYGYNPIDIGYTTLDDNTIKVIQGGRAVLKIYYDISNIPQLLATVNFSIKGQNPKIISILNHLDEEPFDTVWFYKNIMYLESASPQNASDLEKEAYQFNPFDIQIDNLWNSWDNYSRCPNKTGGNYCGWGLTQLDSPKPNKQLLWDWKAHLFHMAFLTNDKKNDIILNYLRLALANVYKWNHKFPTKKVLGHEGVTENNITFVHAKSTLFKDLESDPNLKGYYKAQFPEKPKANEKSFLDAMLIKYYNSKGSNHYYYLDFGEADEQPFKKPVWKVDQLNGLDENYVNKICKVNVPGYKK